jgi:hypothetical protein
MCPMWMLHPQLWRSRYTAVAHDPPFGAHFRPCGMVMNRVDQEDRESRAAQNFPSEAEFAQHEVVV